MVKHFHPLFSCQWDAGTSVEDFGNLKPIMVRVFISWISANASNQGCYFLLGEPFVKHSPAHHCVYSITPCQPFQLHISHLNSSLPSIRKSQLLYPSPGPDYSAVLHNQTSSKNCLLAATSCFWGHIQCGVLRCSGCAPGSIIRDRIW